MKSYKLFQCELELKTSNSTVKTTAWIPEKFAIQGKVLEVKFSDGWSNGWMVKTVYKENPITYEDLVKYENDCMNTRKASDI